MPGKQDTLEATWKIQNKLCKSWAVVNIYCPEASFGLETNNAAKCQAQHGAFTSSRKAESRCMKWKCTFWYVRLMLISGNRGLNALQLGSGTCLSILEALATVPLCCSCISSFQLIIVEPPRTFNPSKRNTVFRVLSSSMKNFPDTGS